MTVRQVGGIGNCTAGGEGVSGKQRQSRTFHRAELLDPVLFPRRIQIPHAAEEGVRLIIGIGGDVIAAGLAGESVIPVFVGGTEVGALQMFIAPVDRSEMSQLSGPVAVEIPEIAFRLL